MNLKVWGLTGTWRGCRHRNAQIWGKKGRFCKNLAKTGGYSPQPPQLHCLCLGGDSNSAHILASEFFKSNSNNGPYPGHSNLGSDERYTCSSLPFMVWWVPYLTRAPGLTSIMVSWQVPYLPKSRKPDFNDGLGGDSNSGPILAPGVYLSKAQIMSPPLATPILCQMKHTSVQVSYLWFPSGYHICPRTAGLTSITA